MKTKRPYKICTPDVTINKIKNILEGTKLVPKELELYNPYPGIYSIRVELDRKQGAFGTNGKGRNIEYTLASGYAEFIERVQNGLYLFTISKTNICHLKKSTGYYFFPDEKEISLNDFQNLSISIKNDFFDSAQDIDQLIANYYCDSIKGRESSNGVLSIPFLDTLSEKIIYLPYNLLLSTVGSNGMAAGNSIDEAIFQSLCEIMERYAGAEVFFKQLTPPTIPKKYIKQFNSINALIEEIESSGRFEVIVKDFSAGLKLPVLGIILKDKKNNQYSLNIGSDSCFETALSRCLTEIFQGINNDSSLIYTLHDIPVEELSCFITETDSNYKKREQEYSNFTKDGSGEFSKSLFASIESYDFDPEIFSILSSYKEENDRVIKTFHERGKNVYIRNTSFLGFPTVFVYIPGASHTGNKNICDVDKKLWKNFINIASNVKKIFNLKNLNQAEIVKLASVLKEVEHASGNEKLEDLVGIELEDDLDVKQMSISYLMTLIWIKLEKFEDANKSLKNFIKYNDHEYYNVVSSYLEYRSAKKNHRDAIILLRNEGSYLSEYIELINKELKLSSKIFSNLKLPICPNCDSCELASSCYTKNKLNAAKKLYSRMNQTTINQNNVMASIKGGYYA